MNIRVHKTHLSTLVLALGFASFAVAQQQEQVDPRPQTSETEGTAADTTPPGRTPTRPTEQGQQTQTDPRPATSPAEGTAADTTPPGRTPTPSGPQPGQPGAAAQQSELVGASVVTAADDEIGTVVDVVFDSTGQPAFVVISSQGEESAVPYSVANKMMSGNDIVMDPSKLQGAPKVKDGEWRSQSAGTSWQRDSARYWDRG